MMLNTTSLSLILGLLGSAWAFDQNPSANAFPPGPSNVPYVSGSFIGLPEVVFDTKSSCERQDIPDSSARAFRDYRNVVHLIATHYIARAMIGSNLDSVKHDCRVIYRSPRDSNPANFQFDNWLASFYTFNGRQISALVHSEFHGWEIPNQCVTLTEHSNCWWNTITFAQSTDGGYSFVEPAPPYNLVASMPYRYTIGNLAGAVGYFQPSNIVRIDGFLYALINTWPYMAQKYGSCLIRTTNVFDPKSWVAWDGKSFAIRFADPYRSSLAPEKHFCEPVFNGQAESLVTLRGGSLFMVSVFTPDRRYGPPGLYLSASRDLVHWSQPSLVAQIRDFLSSEDGASMWSYGYSSLLDPNSTDRNFSSVSDTPYVYYVRIKGGPSNERILFRRKVNLTIR